MEIGDEGSILTFGIAGGDDAGEGYPVRMRTPYGTLTIDKATGAYTFAPNDNTVEQLTANLSISFTLTVRDNFGTTAEQELTVQFLSSADTESYLSDTLIGGAGNDVLDGLGGGDRMEGQDGDDVYIVYQDDDRVVELPNAGTDTVKVHGFVSYTLPDNVENLISFALGIGTGNSLNNALSGNDYVNDILYGRGGMDTLMGGGGEDALYGEEGDDYLYDNAGNNTLDGGAGNDALYVVGFGNNVLLGGTGFDTLAGGQGYDTLYGGGDNDLLVGYQGSDVMSGDLGFDTVYGGQGNDSLYGGGDSDVLFGEQDDDFLSGGAGVDTLLGGLGNDTLFGGAGDDFFMEEGGINAIDGGDGQDILYIARSIAQFTTITDTNTGVTILDGAGLSVVMTNVESVIFTDGSLTLSSGINQAPVGVNDTNAGDAVVEAGTSVAGDDTAAGNVLANDTDPDAGDTLSVSAVNGQAGQVGSAVAGTYGSLVLNADGSYTYTLDNADADTQALADGQTVTDSFSYTVVDNHGLTGSATLDIGIAGAKDRVVVLSGTNYTLAAGEDDLILTGVGNTQGVGNEGDNAIAGNTGPNLLLGAGGNDTLSGGSGKDTLDGGIGNDMLDGGLQDDVLWGGAGDDAIYGDYGTDTAVYSSAWGNYVITGDTTTATVQGEGTDQLTFVENLQFNGVSVSLAGAFNDAPISINDTNDGDAVIEAGSAGPGDATAAGNVLGNDLDADLALGLGESLSVTAVDGVAGQVGVTVVGTYGSIVINADGSYVYTLDNADADTQALAAGQTVIETFTYNVTDLHGLTDLAYLDISIAGANDRITVNSGVSYVLKAGEQDLVLTGTGNINGTGNTLANSLTGNSGANILDGKVGADTLLGGAGSDTYYVDQVGDVVTEDAGAGADRVYSSISYSLGANLEYLVLTGTGDLNGAGNSLDNQLTGTSGANVLDGGAGNDTLDGKVGADTLLGGAGSDTYYVDQVGDVVTEDAGAGADRVYSSISYSLGANLEYLVLTGTGDLNGAGNSLDNQLTGTSGANVLDGGAGRDTLNGNLGNDTYRVQRGSGSDTITDSDATAGNRDVLWFDDAGIGQDQLWFRKVGSDLEVSIIGTGDKALVKGWYAGPANHVEEMRLQSGAHLDETGIQNLVTAMAGMTPPPFNQTSLSISQHAALDAVIVANWQA